MLNTAANLRVHASWDIETTSPGDRQLDNALHTVVQGRIQYQQATRDHVARRTAEGKTGREIKRCLAPYVARDLYRLPEDTAAAV